MPQWLKLVYVCCVLQLFFAKVPRSASRSALLELFSSFGEVVDINLFAEYPVSMLDTSDTHAWLIQSIASAIWAK